MGAAILRRGDTLVWFPEGRRSRTGELQPLRPGLGLLLKHVDAQVAPVRIDGSRKALAPGQRLPRPARITIEFRSPVGPQELSEGRDPEAMMEGLRERLR